MGAFMRKSMIPLLWLALLPGMAHADELALRADAPERYVVKRGDTLWSISARYLASPWRWPTLWGMNREQVRNPHWIYPGDTLVLDRNNGRLRLERGVVRLSPQARPEPLNGAISSLAASALKPFLKRPLVLEEATFNKAPKILAGPDERVVFSTGDRIYSQALPAGGSWQIFRPGRPLRDPHTRELLGYEAIYGGDAQVEELGQDSATLRMQNSVEEVITGDRLIKYQVEELSNYVPHEAGPELQGEVLSVAGGVAEAGQLYNVAINRGKRDGVEAGHVFGVYKRPRVIDKTELPSESAGRVFIYRVFDKIAYGLTLDSRLPINVGDKVAQPQ